jgi:hypothetical protein
MEKVNKYYEQWKYLVKEGDVLLFKGNKIYSRFLSVATDSPYTHCGVASWHNDILECVEFHEKYGGRAVNLENYLKVDTRVIEIFRPLPIFPWQSFNLETGQVDVENIKFVGTKVTDSMRGLTGLPYGWRRIWWIAKHKMAGFRLFYNPSRAAVDSDATEQVIYPVCSTALAYAFSHNDYDLVANKADEWTEPAHIANSTRIDKLFNITNWILTVVG